MNTEISYAHNFNLPREKWYNAHYFLKEVNDFELDRKVGQVSWWFIHKNKS